MEALFTELGGVYGRSWLGDCFGMRQALMELHAEISES